jgi:capsid protein
VYRDWLEMALLKDVLAPLPAAKFDKFAQVKWQPRGFAWVDPLKEVEAERQSVALRIKSRTEACAERGRDFEEVLQEFKAELDLAKKYGIDLPDPALPPTSFKPTADQPTADTTPGLAAGN